MFDIAENWIRDVFAKYLKVPFTTKRCNLIVHYEHTSNYINYNEKSNLIGNSINRKKKPYYHTMLCFISS